MKQKTPGNYAVFIIFMILSIVIIIVSQNYNNKMRRENATSFIINNPTSVLDVTHQYSPPYKRYKYPNSTKTYTGVNVTFLKNNKETTVKFFKSDQIEKIKESQIGLKKPNGTEE